MLSLKKSLIKLFLDISVYRQGKSLGKLQKKLKAVAGIKDNLKYKLKFKFSKNFKEYLSRDFRLWKVYMKNTQLLKYQRGMKAKLKLKTFPSEGNLKRPSEI